MIDFKKLTSTDVDPVHNEVYAEAYKKNLVNRKFESSIVDDLLKLNTKRKEAILNFENSKAKQNKLGQEIAMLKREKKDANSAIEGLQKIKAENKEYEKVLEKIEVEFKGALAVIPNMSHPDVPSGSSEEDNVEVKSYGSPREFGFKAKNHIEVGEALGIINFERAAKVAGARFAFLLGAGAALERALIQLMINTHVNNNGYTEIIPPYIANSNSLYGTSQFPKFKDDVFHLENTDYYLIPTSEVSVTNYYAGEILKEEQLPENFVAFSPCFRSEAGSYGRDTQGLIRQHQFHKVELLKFTHPDESYAEHEKLTSHAESILEQLELPYKRMVLCSGDISFGAAKCYDLEAWMPGQDKYREISSCSNFEDFQARRANIRFRPKGEKAKPQFVHTLNGSGLAVGRTLIAILENYQQEDGSVKIPEVLKPYMGGLDKITKG